MDRIPSFLEKSDWQLLLFGGKGGVGKTTCATAAALHLAGRFPKQDFLIVSTDPAHSLKNCCAGVALPLNLQVLEIDSQASFRKFMDAHQSQLHTIALRGTFLDEADVDQLLHLSLPGLDELMAFHEIAVLAESGAYACILVDTAPTGHTLRFLGLFEVMRNWLDALDALLAKHRYLTALYQGSRAGDESDTFVRDMRGLVERLAALLRDPRRCRFIPVMLAEPLSTHQTRALIDYLEKLWIPVGDILVNRLYPALAGCPACRDARGRQRRELQGAAPLFSRYSLWEIPLHGAEVRGGAALGRFFQGLRPLQAETAETGAVLPVRVETPPELPGKETSLLLFAGKGGVGKTTLACAAAFRLVEEYRDLRVLLLSTDPAHSLSGCLGVPVGPKGACIRPRLTAMELDAPGELVKLRKLYADELATFFDACADGTGFELEFDREVLERLLDLAPPGLDEIMAITRAVQLLEDGAYDTFVIDTAPAGHLIRLLELPELIQDWLKTLFGLFLKYKNLFRLPALSQFLVSLSKGIKTFQALLTDPVKGQLYLVSILTEISYEKTRALLAACRQARIHVPALFLNQATPAGPCPLCNALAEVETRHRQRFAAVFKDMHLTVIYRGSEPQGQERLQQLGEALFQKRLVSPPRGSEIGSPRERERAVL